MNKNEILFIRAKLKNDYYHENASGLGFNIITPYKDYTIIHRLMREMWFRIGLPKRDIWYNKKINNETIKVIIVKDPLITVDYMKWLKSHAGKARILFSYGNRVSNSICPKLIRDFSDEVFSYDGDDCKTYSLTHRKETYLDFFVVNKTGKTIYDVVYVGRDKGRAEKIIEIQRYLNQQGLKTYFHISPSRSFLLFKKPFYKKVIPYKEYLELLSKTKAILNIVPEGQTSITLRDMESVFFEIKCITNNKGITAFDLYHPSRFFILGTDDIGKIGDFLNSKYKKIDENDIQKYRFKNTLEAMIGEKIY